MPKPQVSQTDDSQASQNFVDLAKKVFKVPVSEIKGKDKPKPKPKPPSHSSAL